MGGTVRAEMMTTAASPLTILGPASVSKQLNGHCWNCQHEGDQDCSELEHRAVVLHARSRFHQWFVSAV